MPADARRRAPSAISIADAERLVQRQRRRVASRVGQRLALEKLHDEKRRAVVLADVVERADVRMLELRERARFALEARAELRVGGEQLAAGP